MEETGNDTAKEVTNKSAHKKPTKAVESETSGINFGIGEDVKSKNNTPFNPTEQEPISLGYLMSVESTTRTIKETGLVRPVLVFKFTDNHKERLYTHTEWDIESDVDKFNDKFEWLKQRIKHIFCEFTLFPKDLGNDAKSFEDFFNKVALAFNTGGKDGNPIFTNTLVHLKLVYNLKQGVKAQLGFPGFPNFIERATQGKRTLLSINNKQETVIQPKAVSRKPLTPDDLGQGGAVGEGSEFPTFNN